jgi:hypothetical protein
MEHKVVALEANFDLDCQSCHTNAHDAQRRMYAGMGGHNTPNGPSTMFLARVTCLGCHEKAATLKGHTQVQVAGESSCMSCHGVRYANMLPSWRRGIEQRIAKVTPVVARARAVLNAAGPGRRQVSDSLLRQAQENLDFIREGKPAHNVNYADQLLRGSLDLVRQAVRAGQLPYIVPDVDLGPPLAAGDCLSCHLGVERATVAFRGGGQFGHESHAVRAKLACTECHTSLDDHGGTTVRTRSECSACHHGSKRSCESCHRGYRGAP